jgi:hypothetical protein
MTKKYLILILTMWGFVSAGNLMINGDFEESLLHGWLQARSGLNIVINRAINYDPDPDYEVYVSKANLDGYARLYQVINILDFPLTELEFSANAKLYAYDDWPGAWTAAAVIVSYLNGSDSLLGETKICRYSLDCPWVSCSTLHLITVSDTNWNNYSFNIVDELENLPGINPLEISKIEVALFCTNDWC